MDLSLCVYEVCVVCAGCMCVCEGMNLILRIYPLVGTGNKPKMPLSLPLSLLYFLSQLGKQ